MGMKAYPTYKDSGVPWLGKIPEHWGISQYRAYFQERNSPNKNLQETNLLSISYGKIIQKDINKTEGLLPASFESYNIIEDGDIVLRLTDLQNDHKSLRTALCTQKGIITSAYVTLQPINQTVNSAYFQYQLHIYDVRKAIYGAGGGVRQALNYDAIVRLKSCVPSVEEQNAIVAYLDKKCAEIDELVSRRQAIIEHLKELKQSIIANAVTKGLNPDVPMKDSRIPWLGKIPSHWKILKLRNLLHKTTQKGRPDLPLLSVVREQGVILRDIESKEKNHNYIPDDLSNYKVLRDGQFVINKMKAWQGSYSVSSLTGIVSPAYFIYDVDYTDLIPQFFNVAIRSRAYIGFFNQASDGVRIGQWDLDEAQMRNIPLFVPSIEEQNAIVTYFDKKCAEIDELVARQEQIIEKLKELKTSTIANVVTGKVDVRESI